MRRIIALILCFLLLTTTVYAENAISNASATGSVHASGSCQITLTATIRLDSPVKDLVFPLGTDVSGVSLNGGNAGLTKINGVNCVKLNHLENQTGVFPVTIHYTVNSVVFTDEETQKQTITVPLLYGFKYPVEQMSFSVSLPGEFTDEPEFYSGYHEQDIERSITYSVSGTTISGSVNTQLKDSETLFLTLDAPEGMFPRTRAAGGTLVFDAWAMGICAALAIVYWLLTMRRLPRFPIYRSTPPDGVSAGLVSSYLVRKPADLTMMVVHWAQMGYLIMHLDDNGRVILHKKMEMGNERNSFERRCYSNLFGKKQVVDASSYRYARVYDNTVRASARYSAGFRKNSGNPLIFQILATFVGLFAGIAMGDLITTAPAWRIIWMMVFGTLVPLGVWQIQSAVFSLHLMDKSALIYGIIFGVAILGSCLIVPKALVYALIAVLWGILAGVLGSFGGMRTENGNRVCGDLVGLRRYMRRVTRAELNRIMRSNPGYYYELAPFAMAMGVDRKFAKQFENLHIPACDWLVTGMNSPKTAQEWYPLLREAVESMNVLTKRPFWEKLTDR